METLSTKFSRKIKIVDFLASIFFFRKVKSKDGVGARRAIERPINHRQSTPDAFVLSVFWFRRRGVKGAPRGRPLSHGPERREGGIAG